MGKLAFYGAVGGIGKGLEQEYLLNRASEESEAKDARTFQLERMRQKSATDRQKQQDESAASRLKSQYGPGGYVEKAAVSKSKRDITAQSIDDLHEIQLEEMRQKGQTARETMRITEKDNAFDFKVTKRSETWNPATNETTIIPAQTTVTDKTTNVTYVQEGLAYVPQGWEVPSKSKQDAGQKAMAWLLSSPDSVKARENSLIFLRSFGYLPAEYFNKFGGKRPVKRITERGRSTTTTPTNPVVQ